MVDVHYLEIPVSDIERAVVFFEAVFAVKLERVVVDGYQMAHFPSTGTVTLAQGDVYVPTKAGASFINAAIKSITHRRSELTGG